MFNELHPEDHATLAGLYEREKRVRVTQAEATIAVKANLPPRERRGIVLIDPPFEKRDDDVCALAMLQQGYKRFATGCFMLWYPVTGDGLSRRLVEAARHAGIARMLHVELMVRPAEMSGGLAGSGLIIVNTALAAGGRATRPDACPGTAPAPGRAVMDSRVADRRVARRLPDSGKWI